MHYEVPNTSSIRQIVLPLRAMVGLGGQSLRTMDYAQELMVRGLANGPSSR